MLKNLFRVTMLFLLVTAMMVMVTPSLTLNSMLYPVRIDSMYLAQSELEYEKLLNKGGIDSGRVFIYSPAELRLRFIEITHQLPDSSFIRGWLSIDTTRAKAPLLFIIPDISEGAIQHIATMKQFTGRGFNVCVMDMRGQGRSDGVLYHPGQSAWDVVTAITELKQLPMIDKAAILGIGTGAGIAVSAVGLSPFIVDAVVLQNIPSGLDYLIRRKALDEWGLVIGPLLPSIVRAYEQKTDISTSDMEYQTMLSKMSIPQMYVAANHSSNRTADETVKLYRSSDFYRKRLYIDRESFNKPSGGVNSKQYYDKISAFINSNLPGTFRRSKLRKMAVAGENW